MSHYFVTNMTGGILLGSDTRALSTPKSFSLFCTVGVALLSFVVVKEPKTYEKKGAET